MLLGVVIFESIRIKQAQRGFLCTISIFDNFIRSRNLLNSTEGKVVHPYKPRENVGEKEGFSTDEFAAAALGVEHASTKSAPISQSELKQRVEGLIS